MLVLSMDSKRQRRPNVRLVEIGDVPAAFACGFSHKAKESLEDNRWKYELDNYRETDFNNPIYGFSMPRSSGLTVSDPSVSPRVSSDTQHSRENRNPNSSKLVSEFASTGETNAGKPMLDFGTVKRKGRLMKRRGRSTRGNNGVVGRAWSSKFCPDMSYGNERGFRGFEFGPASNPCYDVYTVEGFKDSSDRDTSNTSKEAHENNCLEPISDAQARGDSDEHWVGDACRGDGALYSHDGPCMAHKSSGGYDDMGSSGVNSVRRWLEELGFGRYSDIFEMHEVDEDVLPLLTIEDLKEMGINAVGTRRKMYTAIQHLREG
ncbi:PREDICTED: uncharacterized protein LOC104597865 [Nelumbo nucifera]|uniref:Uncharacterized protein LOC104597865 n=1 Tax=Nelumbo nucifera TaxID=4432 RepID=A0A1U7ZU65_NELNU|nr:PREDICTED: uncharacterized protein LOC104597865 [Nelumbo nucifera]XP_010257920.1 PREDICTED: uncharacterized protein LOC104597865 [Nelumbo nucifera]XP_010257921.1 PREDICTED: uncharacterized protein LOC104597865 [Nelumbo nucifera]